RKINISLGVLWKHSRELQFSRANITTLSFVETQRCERYRGADPMQEVLNISKNMSMSNFITFQTISCPSSVMTSTVLWLLISLWTSPLVLPSLISYCSFEGKECKK
ncbi:hypothetical protein L9F63_003131, partial [Diploptera punctata]